MEVGVNRLLRAIVQSKTKVYFRHCAFFVDAFNLNCTVGV